MLIEFQEIDVGPGQILSDVIIGKDATIYVKKGGIVEGIVENYGSIIVIGGEANIIIDRDGSAIVHEGRVRAVVREYGKLTINDGYVTVKEEGGFVDDMRAQAHITYEPSIIKNKIFKHFTTIHRGTVALNCMAATPVALHIYPGGTFAGDKKHLAYLSGQISVAGNMHYVVVQDKAEICATKGADIHHLYMVGGIVKVDEHVNLNDVYIKKGHLYMRDRSCANNVILDQHGKITAGYACHMSIRDKGGYLHAQSTSQIKLYRKKIKKN